jgi:Fe-Mn family superoxide dismutase
MRPEHILLFPDSRDERSTEMAYTVPPLPYDFDALEPHIDAQTMEIHHDKHHAAYVTNLNAALEGTEWMDRPIEGVLASLDILPEDKRTAVRNNGGGHANHTFFWEIMGPGGGGDPSGALADAIADTFGSLDELKTQVNDAGVKRFGSGWAWLVWDGTGLAVKSTPNQDSPVIDSDVPLLGIDVWEHAYYLRYQNRRPDYLAAWWNVVNWNAVAARYEAAK